MVKWRVLVLGASGFIGQACAGTLADLGHEISGVGRRAAQGSSRTPYQRRALDADDLGRLVADFGPDLCLNAVGAGNPSASVNAPDADFESNTVFVQRTLETLRKEAPACRYIGISSAAVYGANPHLPWSEDSQPKPCSPYGYHKLCAEMLAAEYHYLYGLATLTLRVFSVYGPGLRKQLFWDLFQRASRADRLSLFGTGRETRDYLYIDDMAAGVALLAGQSRFTSEVLNLGSGQITTVAQACDVLLRELDWRGSHHFTGDEIPGSPLRMEADMTRTSAHGFCPQIDLIEGLRRTAAWLKETNDAI